MKRSLFILGIFLSLLPAAGKQKTTKVSFPLVPVPTDSMEIQDFFWYRQQGTARKRFPDIKATPVNAKNIKVRHVRALAEEWQEKVNHLDLAGSASTEVGLGELRSAIGIAAMSSNLFRATGESKYADVMEHALYNGVCGWQNTSDTDEAQLAAQTIADVAGYAMATSKEHLFINLYIQSDVHVKNKYVDVKLMTTTSTPWYYQVLLQFLFPESGSHHLVLHLRIPGWLSNEPLPNYQYSPCNSKFSLSINGTATVPDIQDGYIVIDRNWCDTDMVQLLMPTPIRRVCRTNDPTRAALQKGPLLYSFLSLPAGTFIKHAETIHSEFDKNRHTNVLSASYYDEKGNTAGTFQAEPYLFNRQKQEAHVFAPFKP